MDNRITQRTVEVITEVHSFVDYVGVVGNCRFANAVARIVWMTSRPNSQLHIWSQLDESRIQEVFEIGCALIEGDLRRAKQRIRFGRDGCNANRIQRLHRRNDCGANADDQNDARETRDGHGD